MTFQREDFGKLLLRAFAGGILLLHGAFKIYADNNFVKERVAEAGLPAFVAYGVFLGEVVAPIMIILGFRARLAGLVMAFSMFSSIVLAHAAQAFSLNDFGAWTIELNALLLVCGLVFFFIGAGQYSLSHRHKWD